MGEEIILQDDKGKKYTVLRVLDADTKKIVDDLSELNINLKSDLYEANNRINDLLDIIKQKEKIINGMASYIENPYKSVYLPQIFKARMGKRDAIIKYFEEMCK